MPLGLCRREEGGGWGEDGAKQSREWAGGGGVTEEGDRDRAVRREASSHWCWVTYQRDHSCIPWFFGNNGGAWTHLPSSPNGMASAPLFFLPRLAVRIACVTQRRRQRVLLWNRYPCSMWLWEMLRVLSGQCVGVFEYAARGGKGSTQ